MHPDRRTHLGPSPDRRHDPELSREPTICPRTPPNAAVRPEPRAGRPCHGIPGELRERTRGDVRTETPDRPACRRRAEVEPHVGLQTPVCFARPAQAAARAQPERQPVDQPNTQVDPTEPWWFGLDDQQLAEVYPYEDWILARSLVGVPAEGDYEDDLFAGLREPARPGFGVSGGED